MSHNSTHKRSSFTGSIGFVMAAAGSAVGLQSKENLRELLGV